MKKIVSTQVRLPEDIHGFIKTEAEKLGIAQNAFLVILLDRGKRLWEAEVNLQLQAK